MCARGLPAHLGRLRSLLEHLVRGEAWRQTLALWRALGQHALVHELAERVKDLGNHREHRREEGGEGGVAQHLAHLDRDLERAHTLLRPPRRLEVEIELVDASDELRLRETHGAAVVLLLLQLLEAAARLCVERDLLLARGPGLVDVGPQGARRHTVHLEQVRAHLELAGGRVLLDDHRTPLLPVGGAPHVAIAAARRRDAGDRAADEQHHASIAAHARGRR